MAHLIDAPGPGCVSTPQVNSTLNDLNDDFANDAMDVDAHIVEDPYADIASVTALVSPNEKQFELFLTKVRLILAAKH
jgi:hypothetical protein